MIYRIKGLMGFKKIKKFQIIYQGFMAEVTVALKLNQGTIRKRAVIVFAALFLVTFFGQAKNCLNHDLIRLMD